MFTIAIFFMLLYIYIDIHASAATYSIELNLVLTFHYDTVDRFKLPVFSGTTPPPPPPPPPL